MRKETKERSHKGARGGGSADVSPYHDKTGFDESIAALQAEMRTEREQILGRTPSNLCDTRLLNPVRSRLK